MSKLIEIARVVAYNTSDGAKAPRGAQHRPLHIYRKTLNPACAVTYGPELKLLQGGDCCEPRCVEGTQCTTRSSISSFSGRAQIRPASTIVNRAFHQDYAQYMRSRGVLYANKLVGAPVPGTNYMMDCSPVAPEVAEGVAVDNDPVIYQGSATTNCACNLTVYKPSNAKFAVQGGVSSSTRLDRLKYDQKNFVASPLKPGVKRQACYFQK